MHWLADSLREHPELAIFLTLALGFFIGRLRFRSLTLGAVTGTLLAGVLIGQLTIDVPDLVKTVAFIGFLFALGFRVGPQFFAGLRKDGVPQLILAVISCVIGLAGAYVMALILGFGPGWGAGLLAGGLTQSAAIGVATDAIGQLPISAAQRKEFTDQIPVGYAVCYLAGTAAAAYFLSSIAPRLLGTRDLAAESHAMERELGVASAPDLAKAYRSITRRAYRVGPGSELDGHTVSAEESLAASHGRRIFLHRFRRGEQLSYTEPDTKLQAGDVVTVTASEADFVNGRMNAIGEEVNDPQLLDYAIETLPVVVSKQAATGVTLEELGQHPEARTLFVTKIVRAGIEIPVGAGTVLHRGDLVTLQGPEDQLERTAKLVGKPQPTSDETDFSYVGLGIVLGGLVVTLLPMVVCLYLGKYVFKFRTPILLGVIAGANTTTASIGAVTDAAKSKVPVLGYTVPYAIGNTLLTIWGTVIVALLA